VIDASKVGVTAAQLMDDLEKDQAEVAETDSQTVGDVMLIVEVRGEDEDGTYSYMRYRCTDARVWVQRGMLHGALEQEQLGDFETDDEED